MTDCQLGIIEYDFNGTASSWLYWGNNMSSSGYEGDTYVQDPLDREYYISYYYYCKLDTLILGILYILLPIMVALPLLGNVAVIYAFSLGQRCRSGLHVNGYLVNLAVADIGFAVVSLLLYFLPRMGASYDFFLIHPRILNYAYFSTVSVSLNTHTIISITRFVAICLPLQRFSSSPQKTVVVLIFTWILSFSICGVVVLTGLDIGTTVWLILSLYVIPVGSVVVMYSLICARLWKKSRNGLNLTAGSSSPHSNDKKVSIYNLWVVPYK